MEDVKIFTEEEREAMEFADKEFRKTVRQAQDTFIQGETLLYGETHMVIQS